MSPSTRILARSPAVTCRSDASRSIISSSSARRLTLLADAGRLVLIGLRSWFVVQAPTTATAVHGATYRTGDTIRESRRADVHLGVTRVTSFTLRETQLATTRLRVVQR